MRILEKPEVRNIQPFIDRAIDEAHKSPCLKSQRGVVIFKEDLFVGGGFNRPTGNRRCTPDTCWNYCNLYTNHAEPESVQDAISKGNGEMLEGASMLHVKVKGLLEVPSEDLTCGGCSEYLAVMLALKQIRLREFVLHLRDNWVAFSMDEFYHQTSNNLSERLGR